MIFFFKDWLLMCLQEKTLVSEKPFLVGDSTVVTPNIPVVTVLSPVSSVVLGPIASTENEVEDDNLAKTITNNDDEKENYEQSTLGGATMLPTNIDDEEDDEIIIRRPAVDKTPSNLKRRLTIGKLLNIKILIRWR